MVVASNSQWQNAFAYNTSGQSYTDKTGIVWGALTACGAQTLAGLYVYPATSVNGPFEVPLASDNNLFTYAVSAPTTCTFPIANGAYTVTLMLLSGGSGNSAGYRKFTVSINGGTATTYDSLVMSGLTYGTFSMVMSSVTNTAGAITIVFTTTGQVGALLAGVQIVPSSTTNAYTMNYPVTLPITTYANTAIYQSAYVAWGTTYTDPTYNKVWSPLASCPGVGFQPSDANRVNTPIVGGGFLYNSIVQVLADITYTFNCTYALANGFYTVTLYQTETGLSAGGRLINVTIFDGNGAFQWLTNYDVYVASGNAILGSAVAVYSGGVVNFNTLSVQFTGMTELSSISIVHQ